jgi:DNA-binding transcriptional LysR family regulator
MDWNDLRHFVAVADASSTLAAARAIGVSQTTVARRLAALEASLGLTLFERLTAGYRLTAAGEALLPAARAVAMAAGEVADTAAALTRDASGTVRLTASRIHAETILPAILHDLHHAHPGILIEVDTSDAFLDLGTGIADVALRSCERPEGAGLVGRRVADDLWAVYCSRGYADTHGLPSSRAALASHEFIGGGGPGVWQLYQPWLAQLGLEERVAVHHGSPTGLLAAVRAGSGLAVLPCIVAEHDPALIRCLPPVPEAPRSVWLLTHERVRHAPRVRVVLDFLAQRLARLALAMPTPRRSRSAEGKAGLAPRP